MAGMTLLEVIVALAILTVGILGLAAALTGTIQVNGFEKDRRLAMATAREKIEQMRATDFSSFFSTWNGHTFAVNGLIAPTSGNQGEVTLLSEAETATFLGGTGGLVDLDGDATLDETNAPSSADPVWRAYSVRVRIRWDDRTQGGADRTSTQRTHDTVTVIHKDGS